MFAVDFKLNRALNKKVHGRRNAVNDYNFLYHSITMFYASLDIEFALKMVA